MPEPDVRQISGACPLDCPDTCSWIVTVKNSEPVALRGDPAHPYTRGSLCNKVENYLAYARSSGRLLYPMLRTGPKGSGEFTRISWGEALERVDGVHPTVLPGSLDLPAPLKTGCSRSGECLGCRRRRRVESRRWTYQPLDRTTRPAADQQRSAL